jgi:hypothetical protein
MMPGIYATQPKVHRSGVTAVDAADPADTSVAIDNKGYGECRFDVTITGTNFQSLEVQALFWNPRQGLWMGGGKRTLRGWGSMPLPLRAAAAPSSSRSQPFPARVSIFRRTTF